MLAEPMPKNRVLEEANLKNGQPFAEKVSGCAYSAAAAVFVAKGLHLTKPAPLDVSLCPQPVTDHQEQFYQRSIALSWHHPRLGYRRIRAVLAREGWTVSRKQVPCIRRREGLKVRSKLNKIPRR